jgi:hypothetical protein
MRALGTTCQPPSQQKSLTIREESGFFDFVMSFKSNASDGRHLRWGEMIIAMIISPRDFHTGKVSSPFEESKSKFYSFFKGVPKWPTALNKNARPQRPGIE